MIDRVEVGADHRDEMKEVRGQAVESVVSRNESSVGVGYVSGFQIADAGFQRGSGRAEITGDRKQNEYCHCSDHQKEDPTREE
jgi:hypothetical protein